MDENTPTAKQCPECAARRQAQRKRLARMAETGQEPPTTGDVQAKCRVHRALADENG